MRFFISAGEPSGDLHAGNLTRSLKSVDANCDVFGLGGERFRAAGADVIYPLAEHAIMGFVRVAGVVPKLADLLDRLTALWHRRRPDAVVLIDYPGYHWWVAKRAKALDIPVVSFVPPQLWAWAGYRVRKMRATFDRALCALPFETNWFQQRGMRAEYIGHPYFDELERQAPDAAFVADQRAGGPVVAMLPGSRHGEVSENTPLLLNTARAIATQVPAARFIFACYRESHCEDIARRLAGANLKANAVVGRTGDAIAAADVAVAVSGSVGLELLWRQVPSVVIYRTSRWNQFLFNRLRTVDHISLVNLIAGRELFPEFLTDDAAHPGPAEHAVRWLTNASDRAAVVRELRDLKASFGQSGACERAAHILIDAYGQARPAAA